MRLCQIHQESLTAIYYERELCKHRLPSFEASARGIMDINAQFEPKEPCSVHQIRPQRLAVLEAAGAFRQGRVVHELYVDDHWCH